MPSHSACHAPAARSCSCTRLPVSSAGVGLRPPRAGERERRADRVALVRASSTIRRGPRRAGSPTSPTSVWAISTTSSAILPSAPAERRERRAQRRDAHARGVPGQRRLGQPELARDRGRRPRGRAPRAPPACRPRRRAARPAARARRARALGLEHAREPGRGLEAERRRHGLLEQRARDHRRRAMLVGEPGAGRGHGRRRRRARARGRGG